MLTYHDIEEYDCRRGPSGLYNNIRPTQSYRICKAAAVNRLGIYYTPGDPLIISKTMSY